MLICGAACSGSHENDSLTRAEKIMEENPDSARTLLQTIDTLHLDRSGKALYAVLDAQSRHKLFLPSPSDSLLDISVDRYSTHGPDSMLMKALFYRAVSLQERGDIRGATRDVVRSREIAASINDDLWKAKNEELVADLALQIQNFQEEIKWRKSAAESYGRAGRTSNRLYTLCDLSTSYLNNNDSIDACTLDDSLSRVISRLPDDNDLKAYHAYNSLFIKNSYGDMARADSLYNFVKNATMGKENKIILSLVRGNILLNREGYNSCLNLLDSIAPEIDNPDQRAMLYDLYYRLSKATADPSLMSRSADSLLSVQSKLISNALQQSVTATQRDFYQGMAEREEAEKRHKEMLLRLIIISACSVVVIGVFVYRRHIRRKERLIREKMTSLLIVSQDLKEASSRNEIISTELNTITRELNDITGELNKSNILNEELERRVTEELRRSEEGESTIRRQKSELKKKSTQINQLTEKLSEKAGQVMEIYTEQWATINMLCKEIVDEGKSDPIKVANVTVELNKMKSKAFYRNIEKKLDLYHDGIIEKLRNQCSGLSEDEIKLCVLSIAGFSIASISHMMDSPASTIYSRKSRVIEKIKKGNPPDKTLFITSIK